MTIFHYEVSRGIFTPRDEFLEWGEFAETPEFEVDNNDAPRAILDSGAMIVNADRQRGIPIPIVLIDPDDHDIQLVVQYTLKSEDFRQRIREAGVLGEPTIRFLSEVG